MEYTKTLLNAIRPKVLALPPDDKRRITYRNLRRALANAREDFSMDGRADYDLANLRHQAQRLAEKLATA